MQATLSKELDAFKRELPTLLSESINLGQFALVHADSIAGIYPSFEAALAAGYDKFALDPFLVKEVVEREEPRYFSRNLQCPT